MTSEEFMQSILVHTIYSEQSGRVAILYHDIVYLTDYGLMYNPDVDRIEDLPLIAAKRYGIRSISGWCGSLSSAIEVARRGCLLARNPLQIIFFSKLWENAESRLFLEMQRNDATEENASSEILRIEAEQTAIRRATIRAAQRKKDVEERERRAKEEEEQAKKLLERAKSLRAMNITSIVSRPVRLIRFDKD